MTDLPRDDNGKLILNDTNSPGQAGHGTPATGIWSSLPFRTFVQGVGTDMAVAAAFVLYDGLATGSTEYKLLLVSAAKTVVMTGLSWVMKRRNPPAGLES